ncbi:MAG: 3-methyladenine DNA glycosylase [Candidatus Marinimicrobia bacterium]|nr:3-methyladenine DNA glycosylase [Candidatus Neomarinimicrobiota bacterium]
MKLENSFYCNTDVVDISKKLLGKVLVTNLSNHLTSGIIVETEAYAGIFDRASHAFNNKRTKRTEIMYKNGGIAYVYLCYGIHNLFNVITNVKDVPHAVLIRAIEPLEGIKEMYRRRKISKKYRLTNGPGKLTQALGIDKNCNGKSLQSDTIWIQDSGIKFLEKDILSSTRIGVDYAGKDAKLLYRFHVKDNKWVSQN